METKYTELIERYFDDLLSEGELKKIEQLQKTDEAFQEEFELFEKVHRAVKLSTVVSLKSEMKEIHERIKPTEKSRLIPLLKLGLAASVLLVIGLGLFAQQYSNQSLYEEAYSPVGDYITNMDEELSDMEKAIRLFEHQQFDSACIAFNRIYSTTQNQAALFYLGHSHYMAGRLTEAVEGLDKISNNYRAEAQWYISLAYLKMGDVSKTIMTLNSIIKSKEDERFVVKAKELKSKLENPLRNLVF